ncbi:hypothetical protein BGZ47_005173 [Haplosporangium gracile]|nr:hypothetical protein BGZ47_005173 [Haplosporangium gracile]
MAGITTLPQEIIYLMADYLDRTTRLRLANTCRKLFQALITPLWKEVYIQSDFPHFNFRLHGKRVDIPPDRPIITNTRLEEHAPLVQNLSLHGPFHPKHYAIVFSHLHTLGLYLDTSYHALDMSMQAEQHRHRAEPIRLNPTIKEIKIEICDPQPTADFWDAISTTLSHPIRLFDIDNEQRFWVYLGLKRLETIIAVDTEASSKKAFETLSRLSKLESLNLSMDILDVRKLSDVVPESTYHLPWNLEHGLGHLSTLTKLRTVSLLDTIQELLETTSVFWTMVFTVLKNPRCLDFHVIQVLQDDALDLFWRACTRSEKFSVKPISRRTSAGGNMKWSRMCPNLTKLHILNRHTEFPIEVFAKALEQLTRAQLTDLVLTRSGGSDVRLSLVTQHLPPLEHFQYESTGFNSQSFRFLQQLLFDNIRTLDMQGCHGLLSRMTFDVLTGCSLLEAFKAFSISVSDIRSNPELWICLGLKHLEALFTNDPTRPNKVGELASE